MKSCNRCNVPLTESIPVKVKDTVGAGDTFDAGFLYGYLNHWELERLLRLAAVCGALSTQSAGGTNGQPTLEEAMKYMGHVSNVTYGDHKYVSG